MKVNNLNSKRNKQIRLEKRGIISVSNESEFQEKISESSQNTDDLYTETILQKLERLDIIQPRKFAQDSIDEKYKFSQETMDEMKIDPDDLKVKV